MDGCQDLLLHTFQSNGGGGTVASSSSDPSYTRQSQHHPELLRQQDQEDNSHNIPPELSLCSDSNRELHHHHRHHLHDSLINPHEESHGDEMTMQSEHSQICEHEMAVQCLAPHACIGDEPQVQDIGDGDVEAPQQMVSEMDTELLKQQVSHSTDEIQAARSMDMPLYFQDNVGSIKNPSISEASTTANPQPSGGQHMAQLSTLLPQVNASKRKRGRAHKYSFDPATCISLNATHEMTHRLGEQGQTGMIMQGLIPHVVTIARGEDVSLTIALFQQRCSWGICLLSALGSVSNVTLRHSETYDSIVTYEGCYDILALSGSLSPMSDGLQNRGGLIVSLAGLDGRVFGGEVMGKFIAASPIKVVVGTFMSDAFRSAIQGADDQSASHTEPANTLTGIQMQSAIC
ncbi:hypothetical protein KP509_38G043900 [Ceratopteris richardii]|uniref:AT-hook motif nuclear-localized protein n=1 Tax=Ceratopteris richardii TaxID=49495 RepID=A0A8T2Q4C4_CERRI|nr:hypothetical protein KP509_38G043900 [Ceratopteris richardii]